MSFNEVLIGIGIGVVTTIITTGITFYVKDYLQERAKFRKFKEKFEQIAGKNAHVMIPLPNVGQVKIVDINEQGIVVESQLCKTFIPLDKVFQTEISLPVENYADVQKTLAVKATKESLDLILPILMDKLKEIFVREFMDTESELNAIVAFQVKSTLKEEGIAVTDKSGEKTPTFKQLLDHADKKGKSEKSGSSK